MPSSREYIKGYEDFVDDDLVTPATPLYYQEAQARKLVDYCGKVKGKRVLDIGVGQGFAAKKLDCSYKVGIDIIRRYLIKANCEKVLGDAECLPFKDESFDTIMCADVIEHVHHPNELISEIRRVLKPKGKLVLRVPYKEKLDQYKDTKYTCGHIRTYDMDSIKSTMAGFRVLKIHYDGFALCKPRFAFILRLATYLQLHRGLTPVYMDEKIANLPNLVGRIFFNPIEVCIVARKRRICAE